LPVLRQLEHHQPQLAPTHARSHKATHQHATKPGRPTISGGEDRGLLYQADAGTSVLSAIQSFFLAGTKGDAAGDAGDAAGDAKGKAARSKVVHRLAVFNALGEITHIVSQLDVIR
jgi:hypothetical protein